MFNFLKYSNFYFAFSGILILASIVALFTFGLNLGIDFAGGSLLEVEFKEQRPLPEEIKEKLTDLDLGDIVVLTTGYRGVIIRMREIDVETHELVIQRLKQGQENGLIEKRFELIGPVIGRELRRRTGIIALLSVLAIIVYIAAAFRKISHFLPSWQYGVAALIALFHDIFIPLGILAVLGYFYGIEFTIPIVVALLTIFGYSVNDTVVVFDRIKENLLGEFSFSFRKIVNKSLSQVFFRSISTSLTTLFVLFALFFLGGETLKPFALILIIGISLGTYSSIFIASPLLVRWLERTRPVK